MNKIEVIRATQPWQQAGAYYVRIQGMDREYHISLREEFDEHDGPGSRYIVLTEDGYPFATCRFYELDKRSALIGRVVVLKEYRGKDNETICWFSAGAVCGFRIMSAAGAGGRYDLRGHRCRFF